jgi:hypothetical protein
MENDWEYRHGRVDPGQDENLNLLESVSVTGPEEGELEQRNNLSHSKDKSESSNVPQRGLLGMSSDSSFRISENILVSASIEISQYSFISEVISDSLSYPDIPASNGSPLLRLPSELIDLVLSFLGPIDLVAVSSTCKHLSGHGKSDLSWQRHVQENIPGVTLTSPVPCNTYRELYISHDPHWFLPKYKIWFCDYFLTGKIIITRFDPRRGCIDGYRLVAERLPPTFTPWEADDHVLIHSFKPRCRLHMDQPVLHLDALSLESVMSSSTQTKPGHRFFAETPMRIDERNNHSVFSNLLLTKPVEVRPNMQLWPPPTIPARERVRNASQEAFVGAGHKPQNRKEMSDQAFRIRRWMEMHASSHALGLHLGEEVYTYATLDPKLYTPTEEKPFRGIWVGDYSGHGCEFLLMNQPDNEEPFDEASVVQADDETLEEWEVRKREERIYRGSIEAIKLTGDPNVPRGEYTFIADDISKTGFVRTATEKQFHGARIVKSRGHVAARMFQDGEFFSIIYVNRL